MAFFDRTGTTLQPTPDARAPWSADMLHGRLLAGLAAAAIERDHGAAEFVPTRLTVDLYRSSAMADTTVTTALVRAGGRVRVVDALIGVGGREVARMSALWLRRGEVPEDDDVPVSANWDVSPPGDATPSLVPADVAFDIRVAGGGGFGAPGPEPRRVWLRDTQELVAGEQLTPFVRVALCADFASPLANAGSQGLDYINADLTLHLGRLPLGEWIGVESDDRVAAAGVSVARCRYFDVDGPIGWSSVCAVLNPRLASGDQ